MKCKKCGTEFEDTNVCPNCGKKHKSVGKAIRITIGIILIIMFGLPMGFVAFINIYEAIDYAKMTPEQKIEYDAKKKAQEEERRKEEQKKIEKEISEQDNSIMVYSVTKDYVKNNLKSPTTAKFPHISKVKIYKNESTYTLKGYVDAQNSFGAMIRNSYTIIVKQISNDKSDSASYQVLAFSFE